MADEHFDERMAAVKRKYGARVDLDLDAEHLKELAGDFLDIVKRHSGRPFPQDPYEQLEIAVGAVFRSWMGKRAVDYRRQFKITPDMANGTAVNVCTMVFGNMGNDSGTGVGFTRNPGTGEKLIYGEYLVNAQGEDVVAGIRTPKPIAELELEMPEIYRQLLELQQPAGVALPRGAGLRVHDREGHALLPADPQRQDECAGHGAHLGGDVQRRVDHQGARAAQGRARDAGAVAGAAAVAEFPRQVTRAGAARLARRGFGAGSCSMPTRRKRKGLAGERIILVREETKPDDIHGFFQAQGILTSRGGKTSHAAVVARGMGKPCVSGCEQIVIDDKARSAIIGETTLHEGDVITIDGGTGHVYAGEVPTVEATFSGEMVTLLAWADEVARLKVMANADTPEDAIRARQFGAVGIGLVRTERMFNSTDRLPIVQEMILAGTQEERQAALDRLLPIQRADFKGIFKAMKGLPVTVRLLDPPMHEFLPTAAQLELEIAHLHQLQRQHQGR